MNKFLVEEVSELIYIEIFSDQICINYEYRKEFLVDGVDSVLNLREKK